MSVADSDSLYVLVGSIRTNRIAGKRLIFLSCADAYASSYKVVTGCVGLGSSTTGVTISHCLRDRHVPSAPCPYDPSAVIVMYFGASSSAGPSGK